MGIAGIKCLLFDLDGVLIDSVNDIADAVNYSMETFGYPRLSDEEIIKNIGQGATNLIKKSLGTSIPENLQDIVKTFKDFYFTHCLIKTKLFSNVLETLQLLDGYHKAVVTNKPGVIAEKILDELGVRDFFEIVVSPEAITKIKPDPEGLLFAMNAMGVIPLETVMVGDSDTDMQAGRNAGVCTCGVSWGIGDPARVEKESPDWFIHKFDDLLSVLKMQDSIS
jgi:phosphoglycolate phosphatase